MPWTDSDQRAAEVAILDGLSDRLERLGIDGLLDGGIPVVDDHPRVVAAMAVENVGTDTVPRLPLTGRRLDRAVTSGRHERLSTLVWRIRLAARLDDLQARRAAFASDDPAAALEAAGLATAEQIAARGDRLRAGTAVPEVGNRAARRAAQRAAHRAARARRQAGR